MAFDRRAYTGAAVKTTLVGGTLSSGGTSIAMAAATGWTLGAGNFVIVINRGNATEEKILCASLSGTTLTVAASGRGYDSTSAAAHLVGEVIELIGSSVDFDEANNAVHQTIGQVTAKGDLLIGTGTNTLGKLGVGANTQILAADSTQATGLKWTPAGVGTIADITSTGGTISVGAPTGPTTNVDLANAGPGATGPIGDGTHVSTVTINAKGQVTALSATAITFPGAAMTQIARTVLGSNGLFSFTAIPGTYHNLVIKGLVRSAVAAVADALSVQFNADSGNNYEYQQLLANGSSATAGVASAQASIVSSSPAIIGNTATANYASVVEILVPEYAATTFFKSAIVTTGGNAAASGAGGVEFVGGSWASTVAITRIDVGAGAALVNNFLTGSTLTLYGVA